MIENARAIGKLGNSDHDILSFDMNIYTERLDNTNMIPDYSKSYSIIIVLFSMLMNIFHCNLSRDFHCTYS